MNEARKHKKCLRRFLEKCLEDPNLYHVIRWDNQQEGRFKLLWVHGGSTIYQKGVHDFIFEKYRKYRGIVIYVLQVKPQVGSGL